MHSCNVYLTPQGLPKYIYLSPPLIFPTTYNGIRTKNHPVWIIPGTAPIRWMGPICNPRWKQKRTEGYVIVSSFTYIDIFWFIKSLLTYTDNNFCFYVEVNFWDVVPYEISLHSILTILKVLNIVLVWNKFMIYPLLLALLTNKVSSELLMALLWHYSSSPQWHKTSVFIFFKEKSQ